MKIILILFIVFVCTCSVLMMRKPSQTSIWNFTLHHKIPENICKDVLKNTIQTVLISTIPDTVDDVSEEQYDIYNKDRNIMIEEPFAMCSQIISFLIGSEYFEMLQRY